MSCNQSTAWISFGIGTFVNIALFFTQFAYSTYTDDIFEITDEKSSKKPNLPTRGFQGLEGFPKIRKTTKLKDILHWIWAHVLGFIFSGLCLVSSVNTFRYSSNKIRKTQIEHLNIICKNLIVNSIPVLWHFFCFIPLTFCSRNYLS